MKIEVLFPEICNLYGDLGNIRYLKECLPEAEIIETSLRSEPRFLSEDIDLVYMGTTTEKGQILVLDRLRPLRAAILEKIEAGMHFLITGNAMELFAYSIEEDGAEVIRGLGLFPGIARRSSVNRFNSLFLGEFRAKLTSPAIQIAGYKSQFGHIYCDAGNETLEEVALFTALRGPGMNRDARGEGIRINNFLATYVIGPLLILNPPFTKWLIKDFLGHDLERLAYEEAAFDSYEHRIKEYSDPNTGLYYWGGSNERR